MRMWIPATSLLTLCSALPFLLGFPSERPGVDFNLCAASYKLALLPNSPLFPYRMKASALFHVSISCKPS